MARHSAAACSRGTGEPVALRKAFRAADPSLTGAVSAGTAAAVLAQLGVGVSIGDTEILLRAYAGESLGKPALVYGQFIKAVQALQQDSSPNLVDGRANVVSVGVPVVATVDFSMILNSVKADIQMARASTPRLSESGVSSVADSNGS